MYEENEATAILEKTNVAFKPEKKKAIKKMMIILSKGTLENVYAAFVLANGMIKLEKH